MNGKVCFDTRTGARGEYGDFVRAFDQAWRGGRERLDDIVALLGPEIHLRAPGLRPTHGVREARTAFERTFELLPDLTARVHRWSARDDALFLEMEFSATIGRRAVTWDNVDRFRFSDGVAVERVAYYDQSPIRRAFLSGPRAFWHLLKRRRSRL